MDREWLPAGPIKRGFYCYLCSKHHERTCALIDRRTYNSNGGESHG